MNVVLIVLIHELHLVHYSASSSDLWLGCWPQRDSQHMIIYCEKWASVSVSLLWVCSTESIACCPVPYWSEMPKSTVLLNHTKSSSLGEQLSSSYTCSKLPPSIHGQRSFQMLWHPWLYSFSNFPLYVKRHTLKLICFLCITTDNMSYGLFPYSWCFSPLIGSEIWFPSTIDKFAFSLTEISKPFLHIRQPSTGVDNSNFWGLVSCNF